MTRSNPYRSRGALGSGAIYVERSADRELAEAVERNDRYPYLLAARQSGKSSVMLRLLNRLDKNAGIAGAYVDLSGFPPAALKDYPRFIRTFCTHLKSILPIPAEDADDDLLLILSDAIGGLESRVVIFVDEIDVLVGVPFKDVFFSQIRSLFNQRARSPETARIQFVLAGAARPDDLITASNRSPFNVGVEILLRDLDETQVEKMMEPLRAAFIVAAPFTGKKIYEHTGGSVFLTQLVLEQLWDRSQKRPRNIVTVRDLEGVVDGIIAEAGTNIHFLNIHSAITSQPALLEAFRDWGVGRRGEPSAMLGLRLSGITTGETRFRNRIYERVFGAAAVLSLEAMRFDALYSPSEVDELERLVQERAGWQDTGASPAQVAELDRLQRRIDDLAAALRKQGQPRTGAIVLGVRLLRISGKGNFGVIWQGADEKTGEKRAVKIFDADRFGVGSALYHFRRGARQLVHLNQGPRRPASIVRFCEIDASALAYSMEFLEGGDLTSIAKRGFSIGHKLRLFRQVCQAVAFAHEQGVLHRDIKPTNVLFGEAGRAVLIDFDLAGPIIDPGQSSSLLTPGYAAPEQLRGQGEGEPSLDVFSLGRLLHYLLIERDPGPTPEGTALDELRDAPPALVRIIRKCTLRDPKQRYQRVAQLQEDLDRSETQPRNVGTPAGLKVADRRLIVSSSMVLALLSILIMLGVFRYMNPWTAAPPQDSGMQAPPVMAMARGIDRVAGEIWREETALLFRRPPRPPSGDATVNADLRRSLDGEYEDYLDELSGLQARMQSLSAELGHVVFGASPPGDRWMGDRVEVLYFLEWRENADDGKHFFHFARAEETIKLPRWDRSDARAAVPRVADRFFELQDPPAEIADEVLFQVRPSLSPEPLWPVSRRAAIENLGYLGDVLEARWFRFDPGLLADGRGEIVVREDSAGPEEHCPRLLCYYGTEVAFNPRAERRVFFSFGAAPSAPAGPPRLGIELFPPSREFAPDPSTMREADACELLDGPAWEAEKGRVLGKRAVEAQSRTGYRCRLDLTVPPDYAEEASPLFRIYVQPPYAVPGCRPIEKTRQAIHNAFKRNILASPPDAK